VSPELHYGLSAPVTVGGVVTQVQPPSTALDWTGVPVLEVGYRFGEGIGALAATYRNVTSEGTGIAPAFDAAGDATVRTRLNLNSLDLDYLSTELQFAQYWDLQWRLGARLAFAYFDSQATGAILAESGSSNFVGAGPHFGLEVRRSLEFAPGLAAFARLEGAVVLGTVSQHFEESVSAGGVVVTSGDSRISGGRSVPVLSFETGLSYTPAHYAPWFRFAFGYELDHWWGLGDLQGSRGDLTVQGLFFRGEFRF
jgi:hypothetical protein